MIKDLWARARPENQADVLYYGSSKQYPWMPAETPGVCGAGCRSSQFLWTAPVVSQFSRSADSRHIPTIAAQLSLLNHIDYSRF